MGTRKMTKWRGWGGKRSGAGRKPLRPGMVRDQRVVVMLARDELAALTALAESKSIPVGTAAYQIVSRSLKRLRAMG